MEKRFSPVSASNGAKRIVVFLRSAASAAGVARMSRGNAKPLLGRYIRLVTRTANAPLVRVAGVAGGGRSAAAPPRARARPPRRAPPRRRGKMVGEGGHKPALVVYRLVQLAPR